MITYTVHEAPDVPADRRDRAEQLAFVKDGFNIWAAALTPLWLMANRLWLVLAFYVSAVALIELAFWAVDIGQQPAAVLMGAIHFLIGYEADTLKRWTLARHGWRQVGSVNGRNAEDCERRFFEAWLPSQPVIQASALTSTSVTAGGQPGSLPTAGATRPGGWRRPRILGGLE